MAHMSHAYPDGCCIYFSFAGTAAAAGVSLATASLIASAVHPNARVGRLLGTKPLRWLGQRSYSIYIWYFPVFVLTRPGVDMDVSIGRAFAIYWPPTRIQGL